jgi:hypothetical protein
MQGKTIHFFMTPPQAFQSPDLAIVALTLDEAAGWNNMRPGRGTIEDNQRR